MPQTIHYDTSFDRKYVIRLPLIGDEYFCYPASKYHPRTAVVYSHNDPRLENDLAMSKGTLVEVTGSVAYALFHSGKYSNVLPDPKALAEEYRLVVREMSRYEDERQLCLAL